MITLSAVQYKTYQDSLKLMRISEEIKSLPGIEQAFAFMGTDINKRTRVSIGLELEDVETAGPDDLILLVQGDKEDDARKALELFAQKMNAKEASGDGTNIEDTNPRSIEKGIFKLSNANLAVISVPGEYAAIEAIKALNQGLNVHIFSDNVTIEDEVYLKEMGKTKNLLVMGPDCGTSIINETPICFANKISSGSVGIIGASGTGIQQATVIIDKLGSGITHAIGTGGRDLSNEVGGITTLMAIDLLSKDEETNVILLISKSPGEMTMKSIVEAAEKVYKKFVFLFLGEEKNRVVSKNTNIVYASGIEEAAAKAVAISRNENCDSVEYAFNRDYSLEIISSEIAEKNNEQKYLRGLYTGGSLAEESLNIISKKLRQPIKSNISKDPDLVLDSISVSSGNCIVDLGEDEFTRGKLHPMIDPTYRADRLIQEYCDAEVSVILCDVVIGYGSHKNPAQVLVNAIEKARGLTKNYVTVVASVCGTQRDPQDLLKQEEILKNAGVLVYPSNQFAAEMAGEIILKSLERSRKNGK